MTTTGYLALIAGSTLAIVTALTTPLRAEDENRKNTPRVGTPKAMQESLEQPINALASGSGAAQESADAQKIGEALDGFPKGDRELKQLFRLQDAISREKEATQ